MTTPNLSLPELVASQSQPHLPVNTSFRFLDSLVHLAAIDRALNTPPGSPADGDCYIVGAAPTGAWSLFSEHDVAAYIGTTWYDLSPQEGWMAWVIDETTLYVFTSGAWVPLVVLT